MKRRNGRQEAIREIVRTKSIKTQAALVEELHSQDYACTQATVSRDIADMGLRKLPEGIYVLAEDLHLQRMLSEFVVSVACSANLVVVTCQPGTASDVAAALDDANLTHLLGSVPGNNKVLMVVDDAANAPELSGLIEKLGSVR